MRYWKGIARLHEKCRAILIQYRTPSCKVLHSVREKCRPPLEKVSHGFGKNLRVPTAGTFRHVLIFLRVFLDTLFGGLQSYVVAFCIQEVSSESSFQESACLSSWLVFEVFVVVFWLVVTFGDPLVLGCLSVFRCDLLIV